MQNDKIYSDTIDSLARTKQEANLLLGELDILSASLFKIGEGDFDSVLTKSVRAKTAYFLNQINGVDKKTLIDELKKRINSQTFLRLTIAFEPTLESIDRFYTWVKQNVGTNISLDLVTDKKIVGGAIIEYNGRVFKSVVLTKIDQYFLEYANI